MPAKTIKKRKHRPKYTPGQKIDIPDKEARDTMFAQIDTGGDGALSIDEVQAAVEHLFPHSNLKQQVRQAFHAADESGDGELERDEFRSFLRLLSFFNEKWPTFKHIEKQHKTGLAEEAFVAAVEQVGLEAYAVTTGHAIEACRAMAAAERQGTGPGLGAEGGAAEAAPARPRKVEFGDFACFCGRRFLHATLPMAGREERDRLFREFDIDHSGSISLEETVVALERLFEVWHTRNAARRRMHLALAVVARCQPSDSTESPCSGIMSTTPLWRRPSGRRTQRWTAPSTKSSSAG